MGFYALPQPKIMKNIDLLSNQGERPAVLRARAKLTVLVAFAVVVFPFATQTAAATVSAISAGEVSSCAVVDTQAYCWGLSTSGELGLGTKTSTDSPTNVTLTGVASLSSGWYRHQCAIMASNGGLRCWGYNEYGGVGDGTTVNALSPTADLMTDVTRVETLGGATCALKAVGVYCWGRNSDGELGDGTTTQRSSPPSTPVLSGVTEIAAGFSHACALTTAKTVFCWGRATYGQLGNGGTTSNVDVLTPTQVSGLSDIALVAAGASHTCAADSGGALYCWGRNNLGQVGQGSNTTLNYFTPQLVLPVSTAVQVACGEFHTCVVTTLATLLCWGGNDYGQTGNGAVSDTVFEPFTVASGVHSISTGDYHTCMVKNGGTRCWGANIYGQLGTGDTFDRSSPPGADIVFTSPTVTSSQSVPPSASVTVSSSPTVSTTGVFEHTISVTASESATLSQSTPYHEPAGQLALSSATKIGIGVGAGVGGTLILVGLIICMIKASRQAPHQGPAVVKTRPGTETSHRHTKANPVQIELPATG